MSRFFHLVGTGLLVGGAFCLGFGAIWLIITGSFFLIGLLPFGIGDLILTRFYSSFIGNVFHFYLAGGVGVCIGLSLLFGQIYSFIVIGGWENKTPGK